MPYLFSHPAILVTAVMIVIHWHSSLGGRIALVAIGCTVSGWSFLKVGAIVMPPALILAILGENILSPSHI